MALLRALETGHLPRAWRTRIELGNKRIGSEAWVSKDAPARLPGSARWSGPLYWNPLQDSTAAAPRELGPRAVLYGTAEGITAPFSDGIGFRGVWMPQPAS